MIDDIMCHNQFVDQHRFCYSKPSKNEEDGTLELDLNMIVNVDNDIVPLVPKFEDAFRFSLTISHDWTLSNRQTFNSKINLLIQLHGDTLHI